MAKIIIKESQLIRVIKETIQETIEQKMNSHTAYDLLDTDELFEYMWLTPSMTGINADLFVDDGGAYKRHSHPLLLFVKNGHGRAVLDFISITISESPRIISTHTHIDLSDTVLSDVFSFIIANTGILKSFADGEVSHDEFIKDLVVSKSTFSESIERLDEMATLRREDSLLPMDIWLDEGATFQGHAPRIKFKASNEQHTTREFSSMLISNPEQIENLPPKTNIDSKDLEKLKKFVTINQSLLLQLANNESDYRTQFLPNMKTVTD